MWCSHFERRWQDPVLYEKLAQTYALIETTSGTMEKTRIFSELISETPSELVGTILALTINKLFPDWKDEPEMGVAEKMAIQILAVAASVDEAQIREDLRSSGDLGTTAETTLQSGGQTSLFPKDIGVQDVFDTFVKVARASGSGSSKEKISLLAGLLSDAKPLEARYILRSVTGTMRLGLGYMIIMDALSIAYVGDKSIRPLIEYGFNVCSDLVSVAAVLAEEGVDGLKQLHASVGIPIRMMAAKKLSNSSEILEKLGGTALVEYKYDGERVQVHKDADIVVLYSRRQEVITEQYPDVVEYVHDHIKARRCVIEGECIAIDRSTGGVRPFQELMRRRRKTGIEEMRDEVPVAVRFFDILFLEDRDVTSLPMLERRQLLEGIIESCEEVDVTTGEVVTEPSEMEDIFANALETGNEGVIAKAVHNESTYQAGSRSWLWIKLKASYKEGFTDSVDLVIVGAMYGRGRRTGVYGAVLASAYDPVNDTYPTVCKIGTGFTDEVFLEFKERLDALQLDRRDPKVLSDIEADVWFQPAVVIEVLGDEITISPTHPAGRGQVEGGGLAIRFPRFTGRWRDDKEANQATTVADLIEAFESQRGRSG
jgi:DNA ligase-1